MADEPVVERFRTWLREHDLPVTPQRIAIAGVLLDADGHLSADEVAAALATRGVKAGTATIYRTIDVLVESGLVVERDFGEGFRRFEAAREGPQHEHLLCTSCGRVEEFHLGPLESMASAVAAQHGFTPERHRLVVYGVCRACHTASVGVALAHSS